MTTIIGISGSLRAASFNTALLHAAAELAPAGVEIQIGDISAFPLYNGDVEAETGIPVAVAQLKDAIADADGLLIVTPEYNGSLPGVLKNAIDWLSRPTDDIQRVFAGKSVALMGATPGGLGTAHAQAAWLPILRALKTRPWFGAGMTVSRAHELFEDGVLADSATREQLGQFIESFSAFAAR